MTREQAYQTVTVDSYVEYYAGQYVVIPFEPVVQPEFFTVVPGKK